MEAVAKVRKDANLPMFPGEEYVAVHTPLILTHSAKHCAGRKTA